MTALTKTAGWIPQAEVPLLAPGGAAQTFDAATLALVGTGGSAGTNFGPTAGTTQPDAGGFHIKTWPGVAALPIGSYAGTLSQTIGGVVQAAQMFTVNIVAYAALGLIYWTDVPTQVRTLLQMKPTRLADGVILSEFTLLTMFLLERFNDRTLYPCLTSYAGLTGNDQTYVDTAVGLLTAIQLYPQKFRGTSGLLDEVKVGNFQFKYTASNDDPRKDWAEQAARALGYVSCIRAARLAKGQSWNPNRATGPSRVQNAGGNTQGLLSTVLNAYENRNDTTLL